MLSRLSTPTKFGVGAAAGAATLAVAVAVAVLAPHATDRIAIGDRSFDRTELRLNDHTGSRQGNVSLDMDASGNVVAAWDSRRQQDGTYGVYARAIDASGVLSDREQQVNVLTASMQESPAVAFAGQRPAFAWRSFRQDGHLGGIVARRLGDESLANEVRIGDQTDVVLAAWPGGETVAAWTTSDVDGRSRVACRVFDADGNPTTGEITVADDAEWNDRVPSIATAGDGSFMVTWGRSARGGAVFDVLAQRFDRDGRAVGDVQRVSETDATDIEPAIAGDGRGRYVIAWLHLDDVNDYDIHVRRYGQDARPMGDAFLASADPTGWQAGAAVDASRRGDFVVAWNTNTDAGRDSDVYVRTFDADARPTSGDVRVNRHTDGRQYMTEARGTGRVAIGDDGRLAVAWQGDSGLGDASAANVTLLLPARRGVLGELATLVRDSRNRLASRRSAGDAGLAFDRAAAPHQPPVFDPELVAEIPTEVEVVSRGGGDIAFDGITTTGWVPPDPHLAVGAEHIVMTANGAIRVVGKDGTFNWQLDINGAGGFWGPVGAGDAGGFVFDPEALYDTLEDRYLVMANERSGGRSYFLLGVSMTSDPSSPSNWWLYRIDVTALAGGDIDSPNFAVDGDYVYMTADFFSPDKYLIYTVTKATAYAGLPLSSASFLRTGTQSFGLPSMYSIDAPRMYMIEHFDSEPSSQLRLWAINNPGGPINIQSTMLTVPTYYNPGNARSQGTGAVVELFEDRFWSCMYRDGSLWACHHTSTTLSPRYARGRWYEIEMNGWPTSGNPPTLRQSGTVDLGENTYLSFNSIFADDAGNAYMVFARSSLSEFWSISRTYRQAGDALGFMSPPAFVKQSMAAYGSTRWGDYSGVVQDPFVPDKFWSHHEYTPGGGQWRTWIACETLGPVVAVPEIPDGLVGTLDIAPTPTSGPTRFGFELPVAGSTAIEIYDVSGRTVRSLELGARDATAHSIQWDGRNDAGSAVANGVYVARVLVDGRPVAAERLVVTR